MMRHQLFLDMDGVLADFDSGYESVFGRKLTRTESGEHDVDWNAVRRHKNFYRDLPMMPDAKDILDTTKSAHPVILTGVPPSIPEARANKLEWVYKNIDYDIEVVTCRSRDKCLYCSPGDVLVDDYTKYMDLWEEAGGVFIVHTDAKSSISQLKRLGFWDL